MTNRQKHNYKNTAAKWLLAVTLFLSFFSFSGSSIHNPAKPDALQTTLLLNRSAGPVKCITFNNTHRRVWKRHCSFVLLIVRDLNLVNLHTRQITTRLRNQLSSNLSAVRNDIFYRAKIISSNTGDGEPPSLA